MVARQVKVNQRFGRLRRPENRSRDVTKISPRLGIFGLYQSPPIPDATHVASIAPLFKTRISMMSRPAADAFVAELADLFAQRGDLSYGEDVSQLEHALQTAHHARMDDAPPALVAAALLHDVGHMLQKAGENAAELGIDTRHEHIGAGYLARAFGPEVTEPIRLHVAAKRYRVTVEPAYLQGLSKASLQSLALQGGPMSESEVEAFLATPAARPALRLRGYDEAGKVPDAEVADFDSYRDLLRDQISSATRC